MEYIYFARPDSDIEGCNVHAYRKESGRLLFGEAGFFGFLFRLLALSLYLLVEIGFQQHCQLSAYNRACALSVSIRHVHIAARPVGQAARVHGQQKRPLGPDDADVVLCAVVAAVFVGDGRLVHIDVRLEIRARAGDLQIVDELSVVLLPVPHDLQRVHHHPGAEEMVVVVILRDLLIRHGEIFPHGLLVFRPVADAPPEGVGQLVVGVDERLVMRLVERRALRDHRVAGDLAGQLHIIIIEVQRQLVRARAVEHLRLVEIIALAGDGVVVAELKIVLGQVMLGAERVDQLLDGLAGNIGGRVVFRGEDGRGRLQQADRAERQRGGGTEFTHRCKPLFSQITDVGS